MHAQAGFNENLFENGLVLSRRYFQVTVGFDHDLFTRPEKMIMLTQYS